MAHWEVDNVWAYLKEATQEEQASLYSTLRVRPKNYFFDYRYKIGVWDGWNYYFDRKEQKIAAGLLNITREMGFEWDRKYSVRSPVEQLGVADLKGIIFSQNQINAFQAVQEGKCRGVFDYVTGSGKTAIIIGITQMLNIRTLIIVPGVTLLHQTKAEFEKYTDLKVGRIGNGFNETDHSIRIIIDDTLKKLPKWRLKDLAADTQLLQMDEVHNTTERLYPFLRMCENAYYRYGYSGTPFDMGKDRAVHILGLFGPVLYSATDVELVQTGRGVPAEFIFIASELPRSSAPDYGKLYDDCIVNNPIFHTQVVDQVEKHADGNTSILVLVKRIKHGLALQQLLMQRKISADFTSGKHDSQKRERTKAAFKEGVLKVLIASDIYKEGIDIPCIDVLIMAAAGESTKDWKQRIGRGLRAHPGKEKVIVYDFSFTGNKIFETHSAKRMKHALGMASSKVFKLDPFINEPIPVVE